MFARPIKEINAEYQAEDRHLPSIQNLIRETCINAGMTRKDMGAVLLAIEEGVSNIIRHAYLYEKGLMRIRIVIFKKRIVFSLIDNGRSFEPDATGKLDLQKLVESGRKGGLGFYMIGKIMDSVEYITSPGFNELRMTKIISRQPEKARLFLGRMFTLRVKFSIYTFLIMLTIIVGAYLIIDSRSTGTIKTHLHDIVKSLSLTVADQAAGYILNRRSDVEFDELVISYMRANPELTMIVLTGDNGSILADTRNIRNLRKIFEPLPNTDAELTGIPQDIPDIDQDSHYLVSDIISGGRAIGKVHMTYTSEQLNKVIDRERRMIVLWTIVGLAVGVGGIYLLSNYFVNPIVRITEKVRRFSSGDIETEVPPEGVEEYFEISKALNEMMSRLRRDRNNIIERERVAKEIEVAGQIQETLLPSKLPDIPGIEIGTFYRAAYRVGGDLFDIFKIDDDNYCLLVADVSGKGIPASLVMSVLRTVIRIQAKGMKSAHNILVSVNEHIKDDIPPGIFVTIMLGVYNVPGRRFNFVSAGHNPLIYFDAKRKTTVKMNPPGTPLGMPLEDKVFYDKLKQQEIRINPGDVIFIYSDGITESMNRAGQKYGMDKLMTFFSENVCGNSYHSPARISELILADIDRHAGIAEQSDDITFILIGCPPGERKSEDPPLESRQVG